MISQLMYLLCRSSKDFIVNVILSLAALDIEI